MLSARSVDAMSVDQIAEGDYGYDVGQVPPQPVIITDANKGQVDDLKPALRELVLDTPGNKAYRVDGQTECIGIQYIELDGTAGKEYTMPADRVATPPTEVSLDGSQNVSPREYLLYLCLRDLFAHTAREDAELLSSMVDMAEASELPAAVVRLAREDVSSVLDG